MGLKVGTTVRGGLVISTPSVDSVNVEWFGAKGDGTTDDGPAIQAAIDHLNGGTSVHAEASGGGQVNFRGKTYLTGQTIVVYGGVHLVGEGPGGDVFSGSDGLLPFRSTVLKLKSGSNVDLLQTASFAALNGQTTVSAYDVPNRFGVYNMTLDGNKAGNSSGWCARIYGRSYWVDRVVFQNGASGGVFTDYAHTAGYDNEAHWSNFRITDCGGVGLDFQGPHDSLVANGFVARCSDIGVRVGQYAGSIMWTNIHAWGSGSTANPYNWSIECGNSAFANCQSDGNGIRLLASGINWVGGTIYGTNTPGEVAITVGDGTARVIQGCRVEARIFNIAAGSMLLRYRANAAINTNHFEGLVNAGTNNRYVANEGKTALSGAQALNAATINVGDTSGFPGSGQFYVGDPANGPSLVTYTGKTATSFTGCSGGSTSTFAGGSPVWQFAGPFGTPNYSWDTILFTEVGPVGTTTSVGLHQVGNASSGFASHAFNRNVVFAGTATFGGTLTINDRDIALGTAAGTKLGTGATQKLGFYGATPIVRPAGTPAAATDAATTQALVNDLRSKLISLGLVS